MCDQWKQIHPRLSLLLRSIQLRVGMFCIDRHWSICRESILNLLFFSNCNRKMCFTSFLSFFRDTPFSTSSWSPNGQEYRRRQCKPVLGLSLNLLGDSWIWMWKRRLKVYNSNFRVLTAHLRQCCTLFELKYFECFNVALSIGDLCGAITDGCELLPPHLGRKLFHQLFLS